MHKIKLKYSFVCKEVEVSEIVTQTFHTSHCHEYLFLYILHESHVCIPVSGDLHGGTTCLIFVSYWKWVRHMEDSNYYYFYCYYYIYKNAELWRLVDSGDELYNVASNTKC